MTAIFPNWTRGFESRLPLHPFNNLHEIGFLQKPTFRGNGVDGRAEPIEKNRLEGLTSSVLRWTSVLQTHARIMEEPLQAGKGERTAERQESCGTDND